VRVEVGGRPRVVGREPKKVPVLPGSVRGAPRDYTTGSAGGQQAKSAASTGAAMWVARGGVRVGQSRRCKLHNSVNSAARLAVSGSPQRASNPMNIGLGFASRKT